MNKITADFPLKKRVLGLQNQLLGYATSCTIDTATGVLTHVELTTQWQSIKIKWGEIMFDDDMDAFYLRPRSEV